MEEDIDRCLEAESGRCQYPLEAVESNAALMVPKILDSDNSLVVGVAIREVEVLVYCRAVVVREDWLDYDEMLSAALVA